MKLFTRSIVPNFLTLANLFSGFLAIIAIANGEFENGAFYILIAGVFDLFDGLTARLINAASEFGVQLDSLCDVVSFGVAPSFMLYKAYFYQFSEVGIVIASLPALAGAVRLATFNVNIHGLDDKDYFFGLPIPSSALTIISFLVFIYLPEVFPKENLEYVIWSLPIIVSIAMVSSIRFDNFPKPSKRILKERPFALLVFVIGFVSIIYTKGVALFPFMAFYIVISLFRHIFKRNIKNKNEILEEEL